MARKRKHKSHLLKLMSDDTEKKTYVTTFEDCVRWFRIINRELFGGVLPNVDVIDIRWRRGSYAFYVYDDWGDLTTLAMNKKYKNKQFFVEVLAHEMIHHYQYIFSGKVDHGVSFFEWQNKFKKKGLNLVIEYDNEKIQN